MRGYVFRGRKISTKVDERVFPSGKKAEVEIVECSSAIVVLPLLNEDSIVLLRQYRPVIERWIYELPAGSLDPGEKHENCVLRELKEETGYSAGRIEKMFEMYMAPGYSVEKLHSYLATELIKGEASLEEDEELTVETIPLDNAIKMIESNEICDAKTIASLLYYLNNKKRLENR